MPRPQQPKFITRAGFEYFLKSRSKSWRAKRDDTCGCPLAKATGYEVGNTLFAPRTPGGDRVNNGFGEALPKWAQNFVKAVDASASNSIGRDECLRILKAA